AWGRFPPRGLCAWSLHVAWLGSMEAIRSAVTPRAPPSMKRVSEVDFRSGTALEQLASHVQELVQLEQGEFGDQTALEVHTAKDFIFNML
ncbi:protein MB21D2-like, partial [Clarias magur]